MAKKDVTIYGAGMSGLVAAINLSREGFRVIVHDIEDDYGGSQIYNPSTHVTPIDVEKTSEYIGIDVGPVFHKIRECPAYFHETKIYWPVYEVYGVERGNRPSSLDTLLYKECLELGVDFEFSSPLREDDILNLQRGSTIIACGLISKAYRMMGVPFLTVYMWISRGEAPFTDYAWLWFDESITEYGYLSAVNHYYFDLLFSLEKRVRDDALDRYKDFMVRNQGIEHDNWDFQTGAVPLATSNNCKLFRDGLIMCGTMAGAIDPFMGFGISGALVTGKVAARAISDPDGAQREFDRLLKGFRKSFYIKEMWKRFVRPYVSRIEKHINLMGPERVNKLLHLSERDRNLIPLPFTIPGFGHVNTITKREY